MRGRLVKGDGEIIEEIVSRERHKAINKVRKHGTYGVWNAVSFFPLTCSICSKRHLEMEPPSKHEQENYCENLTFEHHICVGH